MKYLVQHMSPEGRAGAAVAGWASLGFGVGPYWRRGALSSDVVSASSCWGCVAPTLRVARSAPRRHYCAERRGVAHERRARMTELDLAATKKKQTTVSNTSIAPWLIAVNSFRTLSRHWDCQINRAWGRCLAAIAAIDCPSHLSHPLARL